MRKTAILIAFLCSNALADELAPLSIFGGQDASDIAGSASFVDDEGTDTQSFVDGTNAILRDFVSLLDKTGVKTINPEGEKFDPNFHEAMFEAPSEDHEPGVIIQVIEHGYI